MNLCTSPRRLRQLAACVALAGCTAIPTTPALAGRTQQPRVIEPVAAPASSDPTDAARGTMILIHGGGWVGHSAAGRDLLMTRTGDLLRQRGWRVVSIDHEEGAAGLQDVLNTVSAEVARGTSDGPLCIYGESSGAHLALVAASRVRTIDCVIGLGTPTDLALYKAEASTSTDFRLHLVAGQISRFFGDTPEAMAPWDLVSLAPAIHADVLLMQEGDDVIVSPLHSARFQAARPTTQTVRLTAGDPADPSTGFVHGTLSETGRAEYASAIGAFADRAVADRDAERSAVHTGCAEVDLPLADTGLPGMKRALHCLARRESGSFGRARGDWRRTRINIQGEINAARIWGYLRATNSGRRALAAAAKRRADVSVAIGNRSRVTLRATR